MNTAKLAGILQQDIGYNEPLKKDFHSEAKKVLKKLAGELGLSKGDYDLRSNQAGIACSGEVTLHSDTLYIQVSQSCMGPNAAVLYRTCNGRKDYAGGQNNFTSADRLLDGDFIKRLQHLQ